DACKRSGADAVHPGYGFLSENAPFAQAVIDNGLTWVGPSPEAIKVIGDKLGAKRLLQPLGVPLLEAVELTESADAVRAAQKIIEEAPSPALDQSLRERMGQAALTAARAIGYYSTGTVEFLVSGKEFFFLEVNTRLQVEHPVTELITGLDLVREQIRVAEGE